MGIAGPGEAWDRQGAEEGGVWEIRSGEEVKRTAPGRGLEASLYKIYTFPLSIFPRTILFPPASSSS